MKKQVTQRSVNLWTPEKFHAPRVMNAKARAPKGSTKGAKVLNAYADGGILGGIFDGASFGTYAPASMPYQLAGDTQYMPLTLNRILLNYCYMTFGVIQTVIDQPVEDCFRGGIDIESNILDAKDIQDFQDFLEERQIIQAVKQTMKWARLFGGAGIIINTNQDPSTKLNENAIKAGSPLAMLDADRWELVLQYMTSNNPCPFNYYGEQIHESRVIKVMGKAAPSFLRRRLQGWGMSEIERLIREMNTYTKHGDAIFELIDECKQDVFGIQGYNENILSGDAAAALDSRLQDMAKTKNYHNALIMDKEDTYEQKQLTFSGMADLLKEIRIGIACAAKMPMTKLFGLSASGFNSGEDDIENYNSMVESETRAQAKLVLAKVLPVCFRAKFGQVPDHWVAKFKALRVMSTSDEETVKTQKHARYADDYSKGMLTPKEYAEVQRREALLILDSEVYKGGEPQPPVNPMMEAPGQGEGGSGEQGPAAPKAEPKKPKEAQG